MEKILNVSKELTRDLFSTKTILMVLTDPWTLKDREKQSYVDNLLYLCVKLNAVYYSGSQKHGVEAIDIARFVDSMDYENKEQVSQAYNLYFTDLQVRAPRDRVQLAKNNDVLYEPINFETYNAMGLQAEYNVTRLSVDNRKKLFKILREVSADASAHRTSW